MSGGSGVLGSEPDNFEGTQNYLAFGLENWPAGSSPAGFGEYGQWNDLNGSNRLFSLVEFDFEVDESTGPRGSELNEANLNNDGAQYRRYIQFGSAKIYSDVIYQYGSDEYSAMIPELEFDSLTKADLKFEFDSHQLIASYSTSYVLNGIRVIDEYREISLGRFDYSSEGKMVTAVFDERARWLWSNEVNISTDNASTTQRIDHWNVASPVRLADATNRSLWDRATQGIVAGNVVVNTSIVDGIEDPIVGSVNALQSGNMGKFFSGSWQDGSLQVDKLINPRKVYRLFNQSSGRHLFSMNSQEVDILTGADWVNEGVSYSSPQAATTDVYRFYVNGEDRHFYTASTAERDRIMANQALSHYSYEGAAYQAYGGIDAPEGAVAVVRFLNENTGSHLYSTSGLEQNILSSDSSWINEGIAWYGDSI